MIEFSGAALSLALIIMAISYNVGMFALSHRRVRSEITPERERLYVFLMACLNEDKVLEASLERLAAVPGRVLVLVIDDASDDRTAEVVRTFAVARGEAGSRVRLYQRVLPQARRGKGAALNAGLRYLAAAGHLAGYDPADVVVCVVDADGRLDLDAVPKVDPYFADPAVGAVQIGVRMYNREHGLLARLQDMEFVVYGEIFQRARRHLGSVGMGGNGQFMRLSALGSLDGDPWSDCLTEDLDLGVRLLGKGWTNAYCGLAAVQQQAVLTVGRLLRQRSRWFQGHLQAARLMPLILRDIPGRAAADLLYHLSSPALLLLTSLLPISFAIAIGDTAASSLTAGHSLLAVWWVPWCYVMTFGFAHAYAHVYRRRERVSYPHALLLGHLYVLYGYIWFVSGWWAVGRAVSGRSTWLKTART